MRSLEELIYIEEFNYFVGDTYRWKNYIKPHGFKWNPNEKAWVKPGYTGKIKKIRIKIKNQSNLKGDRGGDQSGICDYDGMTCVCDGY